MKRTIRVLAALLAAALLLAPAASAADLSEHAILLHSAGLLRGTDRGLELGRAPTRAEAAAMLVRLLGAEDEAEALAYTAPFTDVRDWAAPYVQYLWEQGLTRGVDGDTFGSALPCTAQQYAALLLRALGYRTAYAEALAEAEALGIVNDATCPGGPLTRAQMAAMSCAALACTPADGGPDLLADLEASGAVPESSRLRQAVDGWNAYRNAAVSLPQGPYTVSATVLLDGYWSMDTDGGTVEGRRAQASVTVDPAGQRFVCTVSGEDPELPGWPASPVAMAWADGYLYVDDGASRTRQPLAFADALARTPQRMAANALVPPLGAYFAALETPGTWRIQFCPGAYGLWEGLNPSGTETLSQELTVGPGGVLRAVTADLGAYTVTPGRQTYTVYLTVAPAAAVALPDGLDGYADLPVQ